jgi:hypothetical protein
MPGRRGSLPAVRFMDRPTRFARLVMTIVCAPIVIVGLLAHWHPAVYVGMACASAALAFGIADEFTVRRRRSRSGSTTNAQARKAGWRQGDQTSSD